MNYERNGKRQRPITVNLDTKGRESALSLIANMILSPEQVARGMVTRITEQGRYQIRPGMLPLRDMGFERQVLQAMYDMRDEKIPATKENLLKRFAVSDTEAESKLNALLDWRTEDEDVASLAWGLGDWIYSQSQILAAQEVLRIFQSPEGTGDDKYQQAMQIMTAIAPPRTNITVLTGTEMMHEGRANQVERERRLDSSIPVGPSWPWKGLNRRVPNIKTGEITTFLAKSKHGKSTIALLCAEHIAYVLGNEQTGYDVLLLHLETNHHSIYDRIVARKCKVKPAMLRNPTVFRTDVEPFKSKLDAAEKWVADCERTRGRIYYEHCPGIRCGEIDAQIARYKAKAEARGRELVVILDYFQKIDWSEFSQDETKGLNAVAHRLKNIIETQGVFCINLAQFGMDTAYGEKKGAFGGTAINMVSQVVIRVEREDATDTKPLEVNGKQVKDLCGLPMLLHEKGQASSETTFNVIQANDDETGTVPVTMINGYFQITDDKKRWPQEWLLDEQALPTQQRM